MVHYHGTPITPNDACLAAITGRHAFISYRHPQQLAIAAEVCQSFALDNGAFSAWRAGTPVTDWSGFYAWAADAMRLPGCDFAIIPDVIDGTEQENDALLESCPLPHHAAVPVWHLHESLERLERLAHDWPRVALGSSGQWAQVGSSAWWRRMHAVLAVCCDELGRPHGRLHGLRMLNPEIVRRIPFASADSCTVALNIGLDVNWRGPLTPPNKAVRAQVLVARLESAQSPAVWTPPCHNAVAGCLPGLEELS